MAPGANEFDSRAIDESLQMGAGCQTTAKVQVKKT